MVKFDVRGGRRLRKSHNKIKSAKTSKYMCPTCSKESVKRVKIGIWECVSCGAQYAGGAYEFTTSPGVVAKRVITDLSKGNKLDISMEKLEEELFEENSEENDEEDKE